jgi:hypothetical protein
LKTDPSFKNHYTLIYSTDMLAKAWDFYRRKLEINSKDYSLIIKNRQ